MSKTIYRCGCVAKDGQVTSICAKHDAFLGEAKADLEDTIDADAAADA